MRGFRIKRKIKRRKNESNYVVYQLQVMICHFWFTLKDYKDCDESFRILHNLQQENF